MSRATSLFLILAASGCGSPSDAHVVPALVGRPCTPDETGPAGVGSAMVSGNVIGGLAAIQASAVYPEADRRAGIEGVVVVRFVIGLEGRACSAEIARSLSTGLDQVALNAVQDARYVVGRYDGQPAAERMSLPVRFTLP